MGNGALSNWAMAWGRSYTWWNMDSVCDLCRHVGETSSSSIFILYKTTLQLEGRPSKNWRNKFLLWEWKWKMSSLLAAWKQKHSGSDIHVLCFYIDKFLTIYILFAEKRTVLLFPHERLNMTRMKTWRRTVYKIQTWNASGSDEAGTHARRSAASTLAPMCSSSSAPTGTTEFVGNNIFECFLKIKFGPFWEAGCTFPLVHSCISQLVSELQSGQEPENELNTAP